MEMTYRTWLAGIAGVALGVAGGLAAAEDLPTLGANGEPAANAPTPGWVSLCQSTGRDAAPECRMEQRVAIKQTGQLVAQVSIRVPADTRKPLLMVRVPLGLNIAAGVTLDVDGGKAGTLPVQTCDNGGCYVGIPMPAELLAGMQKGNLLDIVFQNLDKTPIKIQMPLDGFSAAYSKIK